MKSLRAIALLVVLIFALSAPLSLAADQWAVIQYKNKKGETICKVQKVSKKTDKTVDGPFKTKQEAEKAKEKRCPKKK